MSIGKHYETGESIPDDIYKKLLAARTFRAGSLSLRQVGASLLSEIMQTRITPQKWDILSPFVFRICFLVPFFLSLIVQTFVCYSFIFLSMVDQ